MVLIFVTELQCCGDRLEAESPNSQVKLEVDVKQMQGSLYVSTAAKIFGKLSTHFDGFVCAVLGIQREHRSAPQSLTISMHKRMGY